MCGICGIFGQGSREMTRRVVNMTDTLAHRGPDAQGHYIDPGRCALGHRRLSIIDLSSSGRQPMSNEDKTVWLVINGEIYNYKELRRRLSGHHFLSESDSEVVIHAYEQYGDSFPEYLRGMFALALYDSRRGQLILARDPVGKKPLYYWEDYRRNIIFASEIKALIAVGVPKAVNYSAIPSWLMYQYSVGTETLFQHIHKLPAGHMMTCRLGDPRPFPVFPYWLLPQSARGTPVALLRSQLEKSVSLRLQSDVPVGSFLSGGIDSSAVTALYRQQNSGDIHTFTATFPGYPSEDKQAQEVSDHLSTIHHPVPITEEMVSGDVEKITWHHDEPLGDAATACTYYLAREARKNGIIVVLAGEGGDELFGGYPWHRYSRFTSLAGRLAWLHGLPKWTNPDITSRSFRWNRLLSILGPDAIMYPTTAMSASNIAWLCVQPLTQDYHSHRDGGYHNRALGADFLNLLPEKFLMKADKGTMAFGVEERLPLLDKYVVESAFLTDPKLKRDKWILRKAVSDLLPKRVVWRPKRGYGTPVAGWLRSDGPLHKQAIERIADGALLKNVCYPEPRNKILSWLRCPPNNGGGRLATDPAGAIWGLFALQVWYDVWFGDK